MSRAAFFQLRFTEQEKRVYEEAAGPRHLSAWIRDACRMRLAAEASEMVAESPPSRPSRAPAQRRPAPPGRPANHHPRCSCARCADVAA